FDSSKAGRINCESWLNVSFPFELPSPVPLTVASITTGPNDFSFPVVMSSACRRFTSAPPSSDQATTYIVFVVVSITGVLVTPLTAVLPPPQGRMLALTGVAPDGAPCAASTKLAFHKYVAFAPVLLFASNAYTESFSVATNTTLCVVPPMVTFATYNGCAKTCASTGCANNFPNWLTFTFDVVRIVSFVFCPVRPLSV